jgi:chemotaxis protein methyltransferase CheR
MTMTSAADEQELELDIMLQAIFDRYHYDFRHYARPHLERRFARARADLGCASAFEILDRIQRDSGALSTLLRCLTIQVSELFRDPSYYAAVREKVVPHLATYPFVRVWVAGCGTGEEAYSLAILLHEAGLLDRALIYATDIDAESLRVGETATYDVERMRGFSENYFRAGGLASLSDYYTAAYGRAAFVPSLRRHVVFSDHSLATDAAFAEVQFVSCRNVLIYFERKLQDRAAGLFEDALCPRGFLGLGAKETLTFSSRALAFETFDAAERIYRLR